MERRIQADRQHSQGRAQVCVEVTEEQNRRGRCDARGQIAGSVEGLPGLVDERGKEMPRFVRKERFRWPTLSELDATEAHSGAVNPVCVNRNVASAATNSIRSDIGRPLLAACPAYGW